MYSRQMRTVSASPRWWQKAMKFSLTASAMDSSVKSPAATRSTVVERLRR